MHPVHADSGSFAQALSQGLRRWIAVGLLAAGLCNGAMPWLKRIGAVEPEAYREYWSIHCSDSPQIASGEWQCAKYTTPERVAQRIAIGDARNPRGYEHLYTVGSPLERVLKLAKELLWAAVLAAGAALAWNAWQRSERWPLPRAALPLPVWFLAALLLTLPLNGGLMAVAGLRFFQFFLIPALGPALLGTLGGWCAGVAALMVSQAVLLPFELVLGMHMFHEWGPSFAMRLAGTMVQPNSLGVFMVTGLAFIRSFAPFAVRHWLAALALACVLLSGTATAIVAFAAWAAIELWRVAGPGRRKWALLVLLLAGVALAAALPLLTGRPNLQLSGTGRLAVLASVFNGPLSDMLIGRGLGVGTNLALTIDPSSGRPADSLVSSLLVQGGLLGTLAFYGTWAWLARRDTRALPFHAVAAVCSLTFNITELFPLNLLLGLAWSHALWTPALPRTRDVST